MIPALGPDGEKVHGIVGTRTAIGVPRLAALGIDHNRFDQDTITLAKGSFNTPRIG